MKIGKTFLGKLKKLKKKTKRKLKNLKPKIKNSNKSEINTSTPKRQKDNSPALPMAPTP